MQLVPLPNKRLRHDEVPLIIRLRQILFCLTVSQERTCFVKSPRHNVMYIKFCLSSRYALLLRRLLPHKRYYKYLPEDKFADNILPRFMCFNGTMGFCEMLNEARFYEIKSKDGSSFELFMVINKKLLLYQKIYISNKKA